MDPRREHVRRLLQVDAHISGNPGQPDDIAQIIDISRMGVVFLSDHPLPLDHRFELTFCFPGSQVQNLLTLTVLQSALIGTHGRYRNSAQFIAMSEEAAALIVEYLTSAPET